MTFETLNLLLLVLLVAGGLWTVMTLDLLRSAIGLALTSVALTLLLFHLGSPLAGVFELSVCVGLITVVFVSTISLTRRLTGEESVERDRSRLRRFAALPVLILTIAAVLLLRHFHVEVAAPPEAAGPVADARELLWNDRRFDLAGQIMILLTGVYGVVVLFKEKSGVPPGGKK